MTGAATEPHPSSNNVAPTAGWTATQLKSALFGTRHDLIFLAGHFSANNALAADLIRADRAIRRAIATYTTDAVFNVAACSVPPSSFDSRDDGLDTSDNARDPGRSHPPSALKESPCLD